jgi:hypothetical protein
MTLQLVNVGKKPGDGSGDPLRVSFEKINENFTELYTNLSIRGNTNVTVSNGTVTSICGKDGDVLLDVNDIAGAVSRGYVENQIQLALTLSRLGAFSSNADVATVLTILNNISLSLNTKANEYDFASFTSSIYTKPEIDLMLQNITTQSKDYGLLGATDHGLITEITSKTIDYGVLPTLPKPISFTGIINDMGYVAQSVTKIVDFGVITHPITQIIDYGILPILILDMIKDFGDIVHAVSNIIDFGNITDSTIQIKDYGIV